MINFKPSLCPNEKADLTQVKYPLLASLKMDGIRTIFMNGRMLSRSLKEIPNEQLQKKFQHLKDYSLKNNVVLDGEMYGHNLTFQQITHLVMTEDLSLIGEKLPEELKFYCFDCIKTSPDVEFIERYNSIKDLRLNNLVVVKQKVVNSKEEVEAMFENALENGYEGLILKSKTGKYKFGRYSYKSGDAYKVKPFITIDAKIIRVEERFENTAESFTNELGRTQHHNFKDEKKSTGIAAVFVVMYNEMEQKVCLTGTEDFRREIWENQKSYIGKMIEFKGMTVGGKDLIRHPVFLRFRSDK